MTDTTAPETPTPPAASARFEVGTDDAATARRFYGEVFGGTFAAEGPAYSIVTTGAGHPLQGGIRHDRRRARRHPGPLRRPVRRRGRRGRHLRCGRVRRRQGRRRRRRHPERPGVAMVDDPAGNTIGVFSPPPA